MLEGVAEARKLGAALRGAGFEVWIDRMDEWPAGAAGRKVRVTGVLEERHDLPVHIQKAGEPPAAGIPVPEGTDLRQASRRSWRIGQKRPVRVGFLTYSGTAQESCLRLMGKKLLVSLAMEGKLQAEGLQAIDEEDDVLTAMDKAWG